MAVKVVREALINDLISVEMAGIYGWNATLILFVDTAEQEMVACWQDFQRQTNIYILLIDWVSLTGSYKVLAQPICSGFSLSLSLSVSFFPLGLKEIQIFKIYWALFLVSYSRVRNEKLLLIAYTCIYKNYLTC